MDLRHFRYFIAVAEQLHFAQAAETLGISPPTLTVQIQEIERHLHTRLLTRTKRSVTLTPAGELFLQEARTVVAQFDRAINMGRRMGRGELGRIEVGYVGSAILSGILQQQLRTFRARWPEIDVGTQEHPMEQLPQLLKDGRIDMAFVRMPLALDSALDSHVVLHDRFCVAVPADHILATSALPIKPRALAQETYIVPEQNLGTHEVARRGKFQARIGATPGSLLSVLTQVSLGAGVAIVPDFLEGVIALPNVVYKPLAGEPIVSEVAAVYRHHEQSPIVDNFIRQIIVSPKASTAAG